MASDLDPFPSVAKDIVDSPIDEDQYCRKCGYNLRGLSGDPVRCPECGKYNDRSAIAVPAPLIRRTLRNMETSPSICVGVFLITLLVALPLMTLDEFAAAGALTLPAVLIWFLPYFRMKSVFDNRTGWRAILRDFHLATVLWIAPLFWMIDVLTAFRPPLNGTVLYMLTYLVAPGVFLLGFLVYRSAQHRIGKLQKDKAVAIARRLLSKETPLGT